jgi:hypothetical protein
MEENNETTPQQEKEEGIKGWIELIATIIMSIATVATAWSGYQAARWGGVMSVHFNQAGANRTESVRSSITGGQLVMFDMSLYMKWLDAAYDEEEFVMTFYEERFREEFTPAFESWLDSNPLDNPDAPPSPFDMEAYQLAKIGEAIELEEKASALFEEGMAANQQSDDYILNGVILASVLFFAGVSTRFRNIRSQIITIVFATVMLAYGLYNIIIYPVA